MNDEDMKCTVIVGKTKIDKTMRISLISDVARLLDAKRGERIVYAIEGRRIIIYNEVPMTLSGFDFELYRGIFNV